MAAAVAARIRHFISLADLTPSELAGLIADAAALKREPVPPDAPLRGRSLAMIFEKPSLRTRVSFEMGMVHLGGHATYLSPAEVGLGRRESVADVARVVSRYVDLVVLRTFAHETTEEFARFSAVPVVNGLSDVSHPCQGLTDIFTIQERKGSAPGIVVAYVGDGNNVCHSLMLAVALAGQTIRVAAPDGYEPQGRTRSAAAAIARGTRATIDVVRDPRDAVRGADVVYTDVWTSMGQEQEYERRRRAFQGYQVNADLLRLAKPDAVVMHDLPAHRGEEITDDVMDGPQSVVFDQAENRLHAQKALVRWLMGVAR
ncbi:MAG: ornithine carbamoyltransferase [Chloroflexota bacterium]|nr:ornithine carbamoyltransferase [Chloroflexota bacterium]MDE3193851.1 ornithine carbamoyltransferase [Chloroflexota bacterium]